MSTAARITAALALTGILGLGACSSTTSATTSADGSASTPATATSSTSPSSPTPSTSTTTARAGTAVAVLAVVVIKGRAPLTGYSRDRFGPAWADVDHNGCNTRDDILAAQLQHVVRADGCRVSSGDAIDPYTRTALYYVRGHSTVDLDHVVAEGDAWQTGAQQLSDTQREAFANDPLNLLAVSATANRAKGDGDAATWLPANKTYRCAYVARQVAVKARYQLWMTPAEHAATARTLATCPTQPAPTGPAGRAAAAPPRPTPTPPTTTAAPAPPPATTVAPAPAPPSATTAAPPADVYYPNCAAARAASAAPLHTGEPGYRPGLDRDGDGVACE